MMPQLQGISTGLRPDPWGACFAPVKQPPFADFFKAKGDLGAFAYGGGDLIKGFLMGILAGVKALGFSSWGGC
jgi:hypothetical protein